MGKRPISKRTAVVVLLLLFCPVIGNAADFELGHPFSEWTPVYHGQYIRTLSQSSYFFHSAGFSILRQWGNRGRLTTSVTIFVPAGVWNNNQWFRDLGDFYSSRYGVEIIQGYSLGSMGQNGLYYRITPGVMVNVISMKGRTGYFGFDSVTGGLALHAMGGLEWEQGLYLAISLSGSAHWIDFIHSADKLEFGSSWQAGIGVGFRYGSFRGGYPQ